MKEDWKEYIFEEVVQFPPVVKLKKGNVYPFIPMENITSGYKYVKPNIEKKITGGGSKFEEGDTLFARITPCLENNKIAQAKDLNGKPGFGSTEYFIFRGKDGISDSDFVYYFSKTQWFTQNAINSMVGASGRQRADAGFVKSLKVNFPPLPTQQKIASILSAYDDLIENNTKRIELLEEQAQLIYEEWFVRMRFPDYENTLIDKDTGLPEGWKVSTIEDLSEVKGGKRLPKGHDLTSEKTSYPYIRVRDLTSGRMNIDEIQFINHDTHIKIKNYIINHTDLYISIAGTVGLVGMVPKILDSANLTENCAKITNLISEDIKEYLYYFLNSENGQHHISSRTGGASQPKLAIERIRSIPITVPNDNILSRFHNSVGVINDFVENLLIQNQKLKEARDILLPRLMMGIIEV